MRQEPPRDNTAYSMHSEQLLASDRAEELYQPAKTRPSETFHAGMLIFWSMSAGTLVLFILLLGSLLGLDYPLLKTPLIVLALFYAVASPIAYHVRKQAPRWTVQKDRFWARTIIVTDVATGTAVLFLTGGTESAFLLLVPIIPFALRLLTGLSYTLIASTVLAAGLAAMVLLETMGWAPHFHSILDNAPENFSKIQWVMVGSVLGILLASVILANSIAKILEEKRDEAAAFSDKMNLSPNPPPNHAKIGGQIEDKCPLSWENVGC